VAGLGRVILPHARGAHQALGGRPPFAVETMLRIHCLQLWWNLRDLAMEEELHERPLYRRFVGLDGAARLHDESTILRFRHLLEKHQLAPQVLATGLTWLAAQPITLGTTQSSITYPRIDLLILLASGRRLSGTTASSRLSIEFLSALSARTVQFV